jgi:hypothetical protein
MLKGPPMSGMKIRSIRRLVILTTLWKTTALACAGQATDFAIFGQQGVSIGQSSTVNGVVASNGDIAVNPFSNFAGLTGGGALDANTLGDFTVNGAVTFNGNVSTGQFANINGPINSGGTVNVGVGATTQAITATGDVIEQQSATTTGNVLAGGSFTNGVFGQNIGNVAANGNVTVDGTVNGHVTYGNTLAVGVFGKINGSTSQGVTTVSPASYTTTNTPPATSFTSGGPNVNGNNSGSASNPLAPGHYGALNIGTFGQLYLTAGNYYFSSFSFSGNSINLLNVGPNSLINIFVTGNVFEDTFANVTVNGASYSSANSALAGDVLLETLGNYSQNSLGSVNFFGTIFAPDGTVTIGQFSNLTGQIIASGQVSIGVEFNQNFVASQLLPEPGTLGMETIGVGMMLLVLRRRMSTSVGREFRR